MLSADANQLSIASTRATLEHLPSAVAIKDVDLRYVWVNAAFAKLFDVHRDAVVGRTSSEVFCDDIRLVDDERELTALSTTTITEDLSTFFLPDGTIRETLTSHASFENETGERWLVSTFHDISDFVDANHSLIERAEDLAAESDALRRQALIDPLTQTLNRRGLKQQEAAMPPSNARSGIGVLAVDIDDFKTVNDTHGHEGGDEVLKLVGRVLKSRTRSDDDVVARLGGDEFVVILSDSTVLETQRIAERIGEALGAGGASPNRREGADDISFSVTVGAGYWPAESATAFEHRLRSVDDLLYAAKRAGRGQVIFREFSDADAGSTSPGAG